MLRLSVQISDRVGASASLAPAADAQTKPCRMVVINVSSSRKASEPKLLRLLALHGHGDKHRQFCQHLENFLQEVLANDDPANLEVECRCIAAPYPDLTRADRHMWWRYDEEGKGDRPLDWAEMEMSLTKIAEELQGASPPYDGVVGFSQGAEMVPRFGGVGHFPFCFQSHGPANHVPFSGHKAPYDNYPLPPPKKKKRKHCMEVGMASIQSIHYTFCMCTHTHSSPTCQRSFPLSTAG